MHSTLLSVVAVSLILQNHDAYSAAFPMSPELARTTVVSSYFDRPTSQMTSLHMQSYDEHGDFFDVERARKQLESLVAGGSGPISSPVHRQPNDDRVSRPAFSTPLSSREYVSTLPEAPLLDVTLPPRPLLTTIERERRTAELELLATLDEGDDYLPDIWDHWFSERGSQAASLLHKADDLMNEGPERFYEAEKILSSLIEEHGVYFAEPLNRLATIYYLQGKLEEALTLNQIVLSVKPWHFGALSHIVLVYAALRDSEKARQWSAFRLPTFTPGNTNRRRARWVERAVAEAKMLLQQGEDGLTKAFGDSDDEWLRTQKTLHHLYENDADSWQ